MTNSAYPDQLASSETKGSASALFAKAGHIQVQQNQGYAKAMQHYTTLTPFRAWGGRVGGLKSVKNYMGICDGTPILMMKRY